MSASTKTFDALKVLLDDFEAAVRAHEMRGEGDIDHVSEAEFDLMLARLRLVSSLHHACVDAEEFVDEVMRTLISKGGTP